MKLTVVCDDPENDCTNCHYWGYWKNSLVKVCVLGFREGDTLSEVDTTRPDSCHKATVHDNDEMLMSIDELDSMIVGVIPTRYKDTLVHYLRKLLGKRTGRTVSSWCPTCPDCGATANGCREEEPPHNEQMKMRCDLCGCDMTLVIRSIYETKKDI